MNYKISHRKTFWKGKKISIQFNQWKLKNFLIKISIYLMEWHSAALLSEPNFVYYFNMLIWFLINEIDTLALQPSRNVGNIRSWNVSM